MKKEEIIKKTIELINEKKESNQIENLTLNTILKYLGISKGSFYYHFKNKDDLLFQAINPLIKNQTQEFKQNIKKLNNLKDQFYLLFEPFISEPNNDKLKHIENFYTNLFFKEYTSEPKFLNTKKLYTKIKNDRKSLLIQALKYNDIKVDKKLTTLLEYIDITIVFYYWSNKVLYKKHTNNEIADLIDMICNLIEKQYKIR